MQKGNHNALIYDPSISRRNRLKSAAAAAYVFERVDIALTPDEVIAKLKLSPIDVIFISGFNTPQEQGFFLNEAKKTKFGHLCAFISVEKQVEESDAAIASGVMRGLDGVLWEPYSITNVAGTVAIADRIKAADVAAKRRAATSLFIDQALAQIDLVGNAILNKDDGKFRLGMQALKKAGEEIKRVAEDALPLVREVFKSKLVEARPQSLELPRQAYGGVSARVQRMLDKKKQGQNPPP